ncbi:hypothetical protein [Methylobacterium sp. J-070]|uniref:hypothetical protein n=1 Tax=Methylobacterium sp. J-070 TaxID=2836650 RepID=UPI001FBB8C8B|nr:hypothetical protein [Methylobacterium sp. J-070]MCJ2053329.1 hypothetical protein [Methylobacterium sp. J-070]
MSIPSISKFPPLPAASIAADRARLASDELLAREHVAFVGNKDSQEKTLKMQESERKYKESHKNNDLQKYALLGLTGSIFGFMPAGAGNMDIQASDNGKAPSDGKPVKASGEVAGNSSVSDTAQYAADVAAELVRQAYSIANYNPHYLSFLMKQHDLMTQH